MECLFVVLEKAAWMQFAAVLQLLGVTFLLWSDLLVVRVDAVCVRGIPRVSPMKGEMVIQASRVALPHPIFRGTSLQSKE